MIGPFVIICIYIYLLYTLLYIADEETSMTNAAVACKHAVTVDDDLQTIALWQKHSWELCIHALHSVQPLLILIR